MPWCSRLHWYSSRSFRCIWLHGRRVWRGKNLRAKVSILVWQACLVSSGDSAIFPGLAQGGDCVLVDFIVSLIGVLFFLLLGVGFFVSGVQEFFLGDA